MAELIIKYGGKVSDQERASLIDKYNSNVTKVSILDLENKHKDIIAKKASCIMM